MSAPRLSQRAGRSLVLDAFSLARQKRACIRQRRGGQPSLPPLYGAGWCLGVRVRAVAGAPATLLRRLWGEAWALRYVPLNDEEEVWVEGHSVSKVRFRILLDEIRPGFHSAKTKS